MDRNREARSHSTRAGNYTRRAAAEAEQAASYYAIAAKTWQHARWLTAHPSLWTQDSTPAGVEESARSWERIADVFLRSSAHSTKHAEFYRGLAADYRAMVSA